ncbi:MAG TPA: hypothetical protein VK151_00065 [Fluviicola sp.]|nr:hypothetical protein [Fluviicola sp.]
MKHLLIFVLFTAQLSFGQDTITFPNQTIWEINSAKLSDTELSRSFLTSLKDNVEKHSDKQIEIIVIEERKAFHSSHNAKPRAESLLTWLKENSIVDPSHLTATGITKIVEEYSGGKFTFPYTVLLVVHTD